MSELTINIADYRLLSRVRNHDRGPDAKVRSGFVVLGSNRDRGEYELEWRAARPPVVDIRSVRRSYPRRGKILRFSNPDSHCVYMMPAHDDTASKDDDPGPMVA